MQVIQLLCPSSLPSQCNLWFLDFHDSESRCIWDMSSRSILFCCRLKALKRGRFISCSLNGSTSPACNDRAYVLLNAALNSEWVQCELGHSSKNILLAQLCASFCFCLQIAIVCWQRPTTLGTVELGFVKEMRNFDNRTWLYQHVPTMTVNHCNLPTRRPSTQLLVKEPQWSHAEILGRTMELRNTKGRT